MLKKPDKLLGTIRCRKAKPDLSCNLLHQMPVVRCGRGRLAARRQDQVEDQAGAVSFGHRQNLVFAVGIEGRVIQFGGIFAAHVYYRLPILVTDDQLAPLAGDRQCDDQGRHHAVRLLGVAVRSEEAALLVDQELVEFRLHRTRRIAEPFGRAVKDVPERLVPGLASHDDLVRRDLPAVTDRPVQYRLFAPSIGRAFSKRHQLLQLRGLERESEDARRLAGNARHRRVEPTVHAAVAWPVD